MGTLPTRSFPRRCDIPPAVVSSAAHDVLLGMSMLSLDIMESCSAKHEQDFHLFCYPVHRVVFPLAHLRVSPGSFLFPDSTSIEMG